MDKNEYNSSLQEIEEYVKNGQYEDAAQVADTIDWKRVRNVKTLCMVSEIYDAVDRLDDSKALLLCAYKHAQLGRNVLYRLVENAIRREDYDDAVEFYSEYIKVAPKDNNRFILKYKIYKGRKSPLKDQIQILEEYTNAEYTERWAYELVKLYQKSGDIEKCVNACDHLTLWFHNGKYVMKALRIKANYAKLTPQQQKEYNEYYNITDEETAKPLQPVKTVVSNTSNETDQTILEVPKLDAAKLVSPKVPVFDKVPEIKATEETEKEEKTTGDPFEITKAVKENASFLSEAVNASNVALANKTTIGNVADEVRKKHQKPANETEVLTEQKDVVSDTNPEDVGDIDFDTSLDEVSEIETDLEDEDLTMEDTGVVEENPMDYSTDFDKFAPGELQSELAKSLHQVISGLKKTPGESQEEPSEDVLEEPVEEIEKTVAETSEEVSTEESQEPSSEKTIEEQKPGGLTIDDILASLNSTKKEAVLKALSEKEAADKAAKAAEEEKASEIQIIDPSEIVVEDDEEDEDDHTYEYLDEIVEDGNNDASDYDDDDEDYDEDEYDEDEYDEDEYDEDEDDEYSEEDYEESEEDRVKTDEASKDLDDTDDEEISEADLEEADLEDENLDLEEANLEDTDLEETDLKEDDLEEDDLEEDDLEEADLEEADVEEPDSAEDEEDSEEELDDSVIDPGHKLTRSELAAFPYYSQIQGMEDQIYRAIKSSLLKEGDRTSKTGNLLIYGRKGSGKTTMGISVAKAIAYRKGAQSTKLAKLYAADLNKKDIASTIAKIAGGTLIIEQAGDLSEETAEQLATAMNFRTDGLLVILEDEKKYIVDLLRRHPSLASKFSAKITIPVLTSDELVDFGLQYADEVDCSISDDGISKLYDMISEEQARGKGNTISYIKTIIDEAKLRVNHFGMGKMFRIMSKKQYDEDDRIVLTASSMK